MGLEYEPSLEPIQTLHSRLLPYALNSESHTLNPKDYTLRTTHSLTHYLLLTAHYTLHTTHYKCATPSRPVVDFVHGSIIRWNISSFRIW